jgi:hypothetical protein
MDGLFLLPANLAEPFEIDLWPIRMLHLRLSQLRL